MRERVASWLHRTGAIDALIQLRRWAPVHTLPIVTYHHVAEDDPTYHYDPGVADATPTQFRQQMEWVVRHCNPIGIDELLRALEGAPLPKNPIMVTFDDGYKSCHDVALPILRAVGVRATFFVATAFIQDRRLYWWERISLALARAAHDVAYIKYPHPLRLDRRDPGTRNLLNALVKNTRGLDVERFLGDLYAAYHVEWSSDVERDAADQLILTWDEIRTLSRAGMDIESHGRHHRVLQTLDDATLLEDLAGSRRDLEAELNRPVRAIAYPVGRRISREPRIRRAVEAAGYRLGLSNGSGVTRLWPAPLSKTFPVDRWDIARLATDRGMSDAMYQTQITLPQFAYVKRRNRD